MNQRNHYVRSLSATVLSLLGLGVMAGGCSAYSPPAEKAIAGEVIDSLGLDQALVEFGAGVAQENVRKE